MEEARASFEKLRQGTLTESEIDEQFSALQLSLQQMPEQGKFLELFSTANRKRTAIVICMNFFQQATGQAFVSTYSAVFVAGLGTINAFTMNIINLTCYLATMAVGLYFNDITGRRLVLHIPKR